MIKSKKDFDLIKLKVADKINCHRMNYFLSDAPCPRLEKQIEIIAIHDGNIIVVEKWDNSDSRSYYSWKPNFNVFVYELV